MKTFKTILTVTNSKDERIQVRGEIRETGKTSQSFDDSVQPEWVVDLEGSPSGTPCAAVYILPEAKAEEMAANGVNVGFWGGYHADVLKIAEVVSINGAR